MMRTRASHCVAGKLIDRSTLMEVKKAVRRVREETPHSLLADLAETKIAIIETKNGNAD